MQPCTLHKVTEHTYWFTPDERTDRPALAAVVGERFTLMLDVGASAAHTRAFLAALDKEGVRRPQMAALTHAHWDHFFGIDALETLPVIAHHQTAAAIERIKDHDFSNAGLDTLVAEGKETDMTRHYMTAELTNEQRQQLELRAPDILFNHALVLNLGGVKCQILHIGGDHAADSSIMFIPEDRLLFLGDCLYATVYDQPSYYTRSNIIRLYQRILGFNVAHFIEGHDDQVMTRSDLEARAEKLRQVYRAIDRRDTADYAALKAAFSDDAEALEMLDYALTGVKA